MEYFIDTVALSVNKHGEELCGDQIEIADTKDGKILVLSDGLGSGVKANILATLTSKIAVTMLKENATLDDTIETIMKTLPLCSVRKLSYSTFSIVKASKDGTVNIFEFDNPSYFYLDNGALCEVPKIRREIHGKIVFESSLKMKLGDQLILVSDGVIHAGVGKLLNFGWQWNDVSAFIEDTMRISGTTSLSHEIMSYTNILYDCMPGDDASVAALTYKEKKTLHLFTGPPKNPTDDKFLAEAFVEARGIKVISGGTTAKIIADKTGNELRVKLDDLRKDLPPTAVMEGADLITEGILTMSRVVDLLKGYRDGKKSTEILQELFEDHGASELSKLILNEASEVVIWLGTAVNPAHQSEGFVFNYQKKVEIVNELKKVLLEMGKEVLLYTI